MSTTAISTSQCQTEAITAASNRYGCLASILDEYFQDCVENVAFHVNENSDLFDFYKTFMEDCPQGKCLCVQTDNFVGLVEKFNSLEKCLAFKAVDPDLVVSVVFRDSESRQNYRVNFNGFRTDLNRLIFSEYRKLQGGGAGLSNSADNLTRLHGMTEKYRNFTEIARGIMHSFNNHLALILGRTQLLSMFSGEVIEKKAAQKGLDIILRATNAATDQIAILQTYARMDSGENNDQVKIAELIDDIMALSMPRWKGMGRGAVTFEYEIDPQLSFLGNRKQIKEALINILMNAVEAEITTGGVIRITAETIGSEILIKVADKGEGIPPENIKKLFTPLFTTRELGTGLGLFVARELVTGCQGRIEIESQPGNGTAVSIFLPVFAG